MVESRNNDVTAIYRCNCDECIFSKEKDSLRHSQSRINAYRALTSPSLIALSSKDPLLTALELSWELRRLSRMETEFRAEYSVIIIELISFLLVLQFFCCIYFYNLLYWGVARDICIILFNEKLFYIFVKNVHINW